MRPCIDGREAHQPSAFDPKRCWYCGLEVALWDHAEHPENIARRSDPEASHVGAEEITRSGRRRGHRALVLADLRAHPGATCDEVGERTGLGRYKAAKRLSDLKNDGIISQGAMRRGSVDGTWQHEWRVVRAYSTGGH